MWRVRAESFAALLRAFVTRPSRRTWVLAGALLVTIAAGAMLFGPVVRWRLRAEAARRRVEVEVGSVWPGWFSVHLARVTVRIPSVPGVEARFDALNVDLGATLRVHEVVAHGGRVLFEGDADHIADGLRAWRGTSGTAAEGATHTSWHLDQLELVWTPTAGGPPAVDAAGVMVERTEHGYRVEVGRAIVKRGTAEIELNGTSADIDSGAVLRGARAARVRVALELPKSDPSPTAAATAAVDPAPPPLPILTQKARGPRARAPSSTSSLDAPHLPLPDLHALRARSVALATLLASRIADGGAVSVDGLELEVGAGGEHIAVGPGPLKIERGNGRVHISLFNADSSATAADATRLSLEGTLPLGADDVAAELSGGPIALALLGVRPGALGLADVDRATVAGKGRVALSASGDAMTFDLDVKVRGMAISNPDLAGETVRGLDFGIGARGLLDDKGQLRLDDASVEMGALQVHARGAVEQAPDHLVVSLAFDAPTASCQRLLDSLPTALIPTLRGVRMAGTFGARGRVAFDSRKIDDLVLDYGIADACKMIEVPEELSRDRFTGAFTHHVYLPDGTIAEEETGPGTPGWADLDHISPFMQVAVLTTEDGAFLHHRGFSHPAFRNALVANLKARRFVRGASTITMQLAKNLFLTRGKTLARKLEEVILTDYLEQVFKKEEMMELYLNIIEFGPNVYGVTRAAEHYFGRKPDELNLAECLFLSSIMPAPLRNHRIYEKGEIPDSWMQHVRALMEIAERTGKISKAELAEGLRETIVFHHEDTPPPPPRAPVVGTRFVDDDAWQELN